MSWNDCLYAYHKKHGGQLLAGEEDGLLLLSFKDRPLAVDLSGAGRGGTVSYVRARIPVILDKPYRLTIAAERKLSGGVNAVLKAVPSLPESSLFPADFGFPELTKKRLIRSDNHPFTKLALGSLEFRNALLACPQDKVEVRPGPGDTHLITITTVSALGTLSGGGGWELDDSSLAVTREEKDQSVRRMETEFISRMDRFLDLARSAYNAVMQWPM